MFKELFKDEDSGSSGHVLKFRGKTDTLSIRIDSAYHDYIEDYMSRREVRNLHNILREFIYSLVDLHASKRLDLLNMTMNEQKNINLNLVINNILTPGNREKQEDDPEILRTRVKALERELRKAKDTMKLLEKQVNELSRENMELRKELENEKKKPGVAVEKMNRVQKKLMEVIEDLEKTYNEIREGIEKPKPSHYKYYLGKLREIAQILNP